MVAKYRCSPFSFFTRSVSRAAVALPVAAALTLGMVAPASAQSVVEAGLKGQGLETTGQGLAAIGDPELEAARALLASLGLLDDDGALALSLPIIMDGVAYTLAEVLQLIDDGADLATVVTVDGTPLTLGDLQTMVAIEAELAALEQRLTGRTFTAGQLAELEDLLEQIGTTGISFATQPAGGVANLGGTTGILAAAATAPAPTIDHTAAITLGATSMSDHWPDTTLGQQVIELDVPYLPYPVSFDWRVLAGSMVPTDLAGGSGLVFDPERVPFDARLCIGTNCDLPTARITIPAYNTESVYIRVERSIYINPPSHYGNQIDVEEWYNGARSIFIQLYNPDSIKFKQSASSPATSSATVAFGLLNSGSKFSTSAHDYRPAWADIDDRHLGRKGGNGVWMPSFNWYSDANTTEVEDNPTVVEPLAEYYAAKANTWFELDTRLEIATTTPHKVDLIAPRPAQENNILDSTGCDEESRYSAVWAQALEERPDFNDPPEFKQLNPLTDRLDLGWVQFYSTAENPEAEYGFIWLRTCTNAGEARDPDTGAVSWATGLPNNLWFSTSNFLFPDGTGVQGVWNNLVAKVQMHTDSEPGVKTVTVPMENNNRCTPGTAACALNAAGTYYAGNQVPITVEYTEPVYSTKATITVNGGTASETTIPAYQYEGQAEGPLLATKQTFLYTIPANGDTSIIVTEVAGATNLWDIAMKASNNGGCNWTFNASGGPTGTCSPDSLQGGVIIVPAQMSDAPIALSVDSNELTSRELIDDGVTITATLNNELAYQNMYVGWLTDRYGSSYAMEETLESPFTAQLTGSDGKTVKVPLYFELVGAAWLARATVTDTELGLTGTDRAWVVELLADDGEAEHIVLGLVTDFAVDAAIPAVSATVLYDGETDPTTSNITLADATYPALSLKYETNPAGEIPTCVEGEWITSDENVAGVPDEDGVWMPVGTGQVTFTWEFTNPCIDSTEYSADSVTFTVTAGEHPALTIPASARDIAITRGNEAVVRWVSNVEALFDSNPSFDPGYEYTIELFGDAWEWDEATGQMIEPASPPVAAATPTQTWSVPARELGCVPESVSDCKVNSYRIASEFLTKLSVAGQPAYAAVVSQEHPLDAEVRLSAVAFITVTAPPARASLSRGGGLVMLDNETQTITVRLDSFQAEHPDSEWSVEVIRSSDDGGTSITNPVVDLASVRGDSYEGTFALSPTLKSSGLKDAYTVNLSARNNPDVAFSIDSFVIEAYNSAALRLVDGAGDYLASLTMDNIGLVNGSLPSDSKEIVALREKLGLIEQVGINSGDYDWSALRDAVQWDISTSVPDSATLNYRRASLWEDLKEIGQNTFTPQTQLAVVGLANDGEVKIRATHAATGMFAEAAVSVNTLRDVFYLFQVTPMQKTTLAYTNGAGDAVVVETNDDGLLALYEPDGIASDVQLKAVDAAGTVWLETLKVDRALSGERNPARLQLYPLNTRTLREVARAEFYLVNPDGTPHTGEVTVRGGVFKNDEHAYGATFRVNEEWNPADTDPNAARVVVPGDDGKLTMNFNSAQFCTAADSNDYCANVNANLLPRDDIHYVFEIIPASGSGLYPLLVEAHGRTSTTRVKAAEQVVQLEYHPEGRESTPFIIGQSVAYGDSGYPRDVRTSTGMVGPNSTYPSPVLGTTMMLWGEPLAAGTSGWLTDLTDEFGASLAGQESVDYSYTFSTFPLVRNSAQLNTTNFEASAWRVDAGPAPVDMRLWAGADVDGSTPSYPSAMDAAAKGTLRRQQTLPFKVADLTTANQLDEDPQVTAVLVDLAEANSLEAAGSGMSSTFDSNSFVNQSIGKLASVKHSSQGLPGFKMIITPSEDNTRFDVFIWAGVDQLGLKEVPYDQNGIALDYGLNQVDLQLGVNMQDSVALAKGDYVKNAAESFNDNKKEKGNSDFGIKTQLSGFYEATILYNWRDKKWEIYTIGGGFEAGIGASYTYNLNLMIGGIVPVTATVELGGALQFSFASKTRYAEVTAGARYYPWAESVTSSAVNDYLMALRINAYINAFVGFGFDYGVVALKIGLYGEITVDNTNRFLSRDYLYYERDREINGQYLYLTGEAGIRFVARLLCFSVQYTLASGSFSYGHGFNDWFEINDYWTQAPSGLPLSPALAGSVGGDNLGLLTPISSSVTLEGRDYLTRPREFAATAPAFGAGPAPLLGAAVLALGLSEPTATRLVSNTYPYAFPEWTGDGHHLLYLDDKGSTDALDTRVAAVTRDWLSSTAYNLAGRRIIDDGGYGDSALSLAGSQGFAAAAWVRAMAGVPAGQEITMDEIALVANSTEIMFAVNATGFDDGWVALSMTDLGMGDINLGANLAPAVAASDGRAVVAWRQVTIDDASNPLDFSAGDRILASAYTGTGWTWPVEVYNGTSGGVRGLTAEMLPDGTALIGYTLEREVSVVDASSSSSEIIATVQDTAYTMLDTAAMLAFAASARAGGNELGFPALDDGDQLAEHQGAVGRTVILENELPFNSNPHAIAANWNGADVFVLGWYSADSDGNGQISLAAVAADGVSMPGFPDGVSRQTVAADPGSIWGFAQVPGGSATDLQVVWATNNLAASDPAYGQDMLQVVGLRDAGSGQLGFTGVIDLLAGDDLAATRVEHVIARKAGGNTLDLLLQGSTATGAVTEIPLFTPDGEPILDPATGAQLVFNEPITDTNLFLAEAEVRDQIHVPAIGVDYANLTVNALTPVAFQLYNSGLGVITSAVVTMDGTDHPFTGLNVTPNTATTLTVLHPTGSRLSNVEYSLVATFDSGRATASEAGLVHFDYPDVGVAAITVTGEHDGLREVQVTLYNEMAAELADSGRSVRVAFFEDSPQGAALAAEHADSSAGQLPGLLPGSGAVLPPAKPLVSAPALDAESDGTFTVPATDLALVDAGAYTFTATFDAELWVGAGNEIPEAGLPFYVYTWLEEPSADDPAAVVVVPEVVTSNNTAFVLLDSLLYRRGTDVTILVDQLAQEPSTPLAPASDGGGFDRLNHPVAVAPVTLATTGASAPSRVVEADSQNQGLETTLASTQLAAAEEPLVTTAQVSVFNNKLSESITGVITAVLLDGEGNVLERITSAPVTIAPEATELFEVEFSQLGDRVIAYFGEITDDDDDASLTALAFDGLSVGLADFTDDGEGNLVASVSTNLTSTIATWVTANPGSTVTVNGVAATSGWVVAVPSVITIVVTAPGGATQTYILTVDPVAMCPWDGLEALPAQSADCVFPGFAYEVLEHFGTFTGSGTRSAKVDADHTGFTRLHHHGLDGVTTQVDPADHEITAGSTVITLSEAYLKTLPNGNHTFTAEYSDGAATPIRLTVAVPADNTGPGGTGGGEGSGTGDGQGSGDGSGQGGNGSGGSGTGGGQGSGSGSGGSSTTTTTTTTTTVGRNRLLRTGASSLGLLLAAGLTATGLATRRTSRRRPQ